MTEVVLAPTSGVAHPLAQAPDPVFAAEMLGAGIAVEPSPGRATVVAPIDGQLVKVHPHAFVVAGSDGTAVLVHLGIDTVKLGGEGFEVLRAEQDQVSAGDGVVAWDATAITAQGLSAWVLVCVLDTPAGSIPGPADGSAVSVGEPLLQLPQGSQG